jgi:hypothetical protein
LRFLVHGWNFTPNSSLGLKILDARALISPLF